LFIFLGSGKRFSIGRLPGLGISATVRAGEAPESSRGFEGLGISFSPAFIV
jgi:hypothetical protein